MAQELNTIARPYATAVFKLAQETDKLDLWSEMLAFLGAAATDEALAEIIGNPAIERQSLEALMLDIGGGRLNEQGQNFVKLLVQNGKLSVLPQIADLYESLKSDIQGSIDVHIVSAYALGKPEENKLAKALKNFLQREVVVSSEVDKTLIGGVRIHAGDTVIDGSVQAQLAKLATELEL